MVNKIIQLTKYRIFLFYYDKMKDAVILIFFRRFVADFKTLTSVCNVPAILKVYD